MTVDAGTARRGVITIARRSLVGVPRAASTISVLAGLSVLTGLLETASLYLIGRMAVSVAEPDATIAVSVFTSRPLVLDFAPAAGIVLGLLMVLLTLAYPIARLSSRLAATALVKYRDTILGAYLRSTWTAKDQHREGRLQELAGEYCRRQEMIVRQFLTVLVAGSSLVILLLGALIVAPLLAAVCGMTFALITLPLRPALKSVRKRSARFAEADASIMSEVAQAARMAREIETFDVGEEVAKDLRGSTHAAGSLMVNMRTLSRLVPVLFQYAALVCVLGLLIAVYAIDLDDAGAIGAVLLILVRALGYIRQVQAGLQFVNEYGPYADAFEDEVIKLVPRSNSDVARFRALSGTVELSDLSFGYEGPEGRLVLDGVTISLPSGAAVAIIGESGAGKSTLAQLLVGLRQPTSGHLVLGGVSTTGLDRSEWSGLVHYVPQDNQLIRGTVRDNVAFYRPSFSEAEISQALSDANLGDLLDQLPDGLDTPIGPGHAELSGGQRQRLGIARALLGTPSILVLDEPTSALDARSEDLVHEALLGLKGGVTILLVAHKKSSLQICDTGWLVDNGAIEVLDIDEMRSFVIEDRALPSGGHQDLPVGEKCI